MNNLGTKTIETERFILSKIKEITIDNRQEVNRFIIDNWYTTEMAVEGKLYDMSKMSGFVSYDDNSQITGLVTYIVTDDEYEIMSLDSVYENKGIGTKLVNKVVEKAKENKIGKIRLITTNDNINAIKFYQKRGFDLIKIYRNAVDVARSIKPEIPLYGDFDIPIKHEIEFEMKL